MRAPLLLLLVVAAFPSHLAMAQDTSDESKIIEKIALLEGKVEQDDKLPGHPVVGVSFDGSGRFTANYIHLLKSFPKLTWLDLGGTDITDAGLKRLPELKNLIEVNLCETSVTPTALAELRKAAPRLRIFDDFAIEGLAGHVRRDGTGRGRRIIDVSFAGNHKFSDASMPLLKPLKHLKVLQIQDTQITDEGLKELSELEKLEVLVLMRNPITDVGLKHLKELGNLYSLWLGNTKITDVGLTELLKLENLTQLELFQSQITDAGLKTVSKLKGLTVLNVGSSRITDAGLKELSALRNLTRLELMDTQITDAGLKELRVFKNLVLLNLRGTRITDAGLIELKELKNLSRLDVRGTKITAAGATRLKEFLPHVNVVR
jgi:internalin A